MSKYDKLWEYVGGRGEDSFKLSFAQIADIAGVPLDHSFLKYKKEPIPFGYTVDKISIKGQTVAFSKICEDKNTSR